MTDSKEDVREKWKREQERLLKLLDTRDSEAVADVDKVSLVGGMDISFFPGDDERAVAAFVVMQVPEMKVVYEDLQEVKLELPYIPHYLAFRESPLLMPLLAKLKDSKPELYPQVVILDGNGTLHPRKMGLACHLGVLADIPTIGVAKDILVVDGLTRDVADKLSEELEKAGDWKPLVGDSGFTYGAIFRASDKSKKPVYVSTGHKICLETALKIVKKCSGKNKIPEPTRQADLRSRALITRLVSKR